MTSTVAIIPARSGSKSLVDKNIKKLSGHPLIAYSIVAAKMSKLIDRVVVSTNSQKYANIAEKYGAEVPLFALMNILQIFPQIEISWFMQ